MEDVHIHVQIMYVLRQWDWAVSEEHAGSGFIHKIPPLIESYDHMLDRVVRKTHRATSFTKLAITSSDYGRNLSPCLYIHLTTSHKSVWNYSRYGTHRWEICYRTMGTIMANHYRSERQIITSEPDLDYGFDWIHSSVETKMDRRLVSSILSSMFDQILLVVWFDKSTNSSESSYRPKWGMNTLHS